MSNETVDKVTVRMYRHGFGDCFLLQFFNGDQRVSNMVIDCGIKLNTKSDDVPIKDVIEDLKTTLTVKGSKRPVIDVLVATHEHWDHIAYFHPTKFPDYFSDFNIKQLWLAWTENPADPEAAVINGRLRQGAAALQIAAKRLKATSSREVAQFKGISGQGTMLKAREDFNASMNEVLGFYGLSVTKTSPSGIKFNPKTKLSVETQVAMENLIKLGKRGSIKFLEPGTTVDAQLVPKGLRAYVLGPPKSSLINKSNPSSKADHETYFGIDNTGLAGFVDGLLQMGISGGGGSSANKSTVIDGPFKSGVGIDATAARQHAYFKSTYFKAKERYRRIENSWLDAAGQFALQLDGAINNTSLVLALEIESTGKVLLFPGDAQVGSWLSWHSYQWKVERDGTTKMVTAEQLLNNTVLYKVSHHGSHNATVRDKGLEMMTHSELVAMIPEKEKSYNGILHQPLLNRLDELCKGRVIISADADHDPMDLRAKRPPQMTATEWEKFKNNLTIEKLYVEYSVR